MDSCNADAFSSGSGTWRTGKPLGSVPACVCRMSAHNARNWRTRLSCPFGRMALVLIKPMPTPFCRRDTVYLYVSKTGASLNAELVKSGYARAAGDSKYDVAAFVRGTNTSSGSSSSGSTPGTDVHVRGYYRKDGTYVRPHTRTAPGTKSSGSSSRSGSRRR